MNRVDIINRAITALNVAQEKTEHALLENDFDSITDVPTLMNIVSDYLIQLDDSESEINA